jgi:hypothetical protein
MSNHRYCNKSIYSSMKCSAFHEELGHIDFPSAPIRQHATASMTNKLSAYDGKRMIYEVSPGSAKLITRSRCFLILLGEIYKLVDDVKAISTGLCLDCVKNGKKRKRCRIDHE